MRIKCHISSFVATTLSKWVELKCEQKAKGDGKTEKTSSEDMKKIFWVRLMFTWWEIRHQTIVLLRFLHLDYRTHTRMRKVLKYFDEKIKWQRQFSTGFATPFSKQVLVLILYVHPRKKGEQASELCMNNTFLFALTPLCLATPDFICLHFRKTRLNPRTWARGTYFYFIFSLVQCHIILSAFLLRWWKWWKKANRLWE